jgi:hypothetical protein
MTIGLLLQELRHTRAVQEILAAAPFWESGADSRERGWLTKG